MGFIVGCPVGLEPTTFRTTNLQPYNHKILTCKVLLHNDFRIAAILRQHHSEHAIPNVKTKLTFLAGFRNSLYFCGAIVAIGEQDDGKMKG